MSGPRLGDYFDNRQEPGRPGLPVMSVTMNDSLVLRDDLDRRTESALRPDQHLLVRKGDIAYNMMRMWQGACGLAEADGIVSPAYVVLAPRPGIDSRFAYHWFKSARMIHLFWSYSHGLTEDRLRLYFDAFCEIPVAPPALEQQGRIVAVLDAWDQAIDKNEKLIAAEFGRQSVLLKYLFAGRQFGQAEGTQYKRLPLSEISDCYSGGTPDRADAQSFGGGIPWVKSGEVVSSNINTTEETLSERGLASSSAKWVPAGSTLVAMYGANAGQVGRLSVNATTNQAIFAVVPRIEVVTADYLYHSVINAIPSLMRKVQGSGQPNLSAGILKEEKILVPDLPDQIKISQVATALETSIELLKSARTTAEPTARFDAKAADWRAVTRGEFPMKFLGFRSDPATPRYALVDGTANPLSLLNAADESRLCFPANCTEDAAKITWLYREFERAPDKLSFAGHWTVDATGMLRVEDARHTYRFENMPAAGSNASVAAFKTNRASGGETHISQFTNKNLSKPEANKFVVSFFKAVIEGKVA